MPAIGWIFLIFALGMVLGSLFLLRDSAHTMPISREKMAKIRKRMAEMEAEKRADDKEE